ncbi:Aste57867_24017 [Aphanomyces stellatus]|uniref:Aste57867_24017 protein n=1 Tax=Aphanomyces stellatus TaxID=120398 RepID=A0A485LP52_9STRA|nr:hypothetical protein As57867_023944 [Aphanomyces stellatus]VFU00660.1 Aste57867_24017 [Aphanomyces stellatus]
MGVTASTAAVVGASIVVGLLGLLTTVLLRVETPPLNCRLACACGLVQGAVAAASSLHIVCYCDDCQALAATLQQKYPSMASYVNAQGGTHVAAVFPSDVRITTGLEKLVLGKMKPRTGTRRVYASCCGTPFFNAVKAAIPFLGLLPPAIVAADDKSFSAPQFQIWTKYATGPVADGTTTMPLGLKLKMLTRFLWNASKARPHPIDVHQPATLLV